MPFLKRVEHDDWWPQDEPKIEPEILLRQVGPNAFQLIDGFAYKVPGWKKRPYEIPGHDLTSAPRADESSTSPPPQNSTDLASVPYIFWWFVASYGRHTRAALMHDHLVDAPKIKRRDADTAFRLALQESKVSWFVRWLMWTAVSLATNAKSFWGRVYVSGFVFFLLAFAFALLYWAFGRYEWWPIGFLPWVPDGGSNWPFGSVNSWPFATHGWLPWGGQPWLPALTVALLGLWGARRWLLGMVAVVVIGPPTIFVLIALGTSWAISVVMSPIVWIFSGAAFRGEPPEAPSAPRPYRQQSRPF